MTETEEATVLYQENEDAIEGGEEEGGDGGISGASTHTGFWLKTATMWAHTLLKYLNPKYGAWLENTDGSVDPVILVDHILESWIGEYLSVPTKTLLHNIKHDMQTDNWAAAGF